ncbi:MAG: hypothetical protein ACI9G6_003329 [Limisphaerales bacterium]|jgi:hypothetical protein
MLLVAILLSFLTPSSFPPSTLPHDYHVSKTNVRYAADKAQVQVEMHVFADDLEKDMVASGASEPLEIGTKRQHEDAERYLASYLEKNFRIKWNGEELPLKIAGYELADDLHGLWIYFSAPVENPPAEVTITNTMMTGIYPDQKNIVKIYNGTERSATLLMSKDRPEADWSPR